jgi:hypothetical protein
MDTKEKANIKSGKNGKNSTRNIENTEKKWREKIASITKNRNANQENTERRWRENIISITRNRDVVTTKNILITTFIVDTENTPMTNIVIMGTTILKDIGMIIRVIGDLGSNGIDTQENTHTYTNMEDITAKVHI